MKQHWRQGHRGISGLTRREMFGFVGGFITVSLSGSLSGCLRETAADPSPATATELGNSAPTLAANPACVVRPQQTEGPYFVDQRLNRSDVRSDPGSGVIKAGVPLRLVFQVSQVSPSACTPLSDATVDIWHCDAEGVYSDVNDRQGNRVGQKFLRGYQTTDANGRAEFITVYPGWYPGRTVHIHFKIRTAAATQPSYEFTSQIYFDDAITDQVQTQSPYAARGQRSERNDQDGIFQRGGEQLILQLAEAEAGYVGQFEIGLELA